MSVRIARAKRRQHVVDERVDETFADGQLDASLLKPAQRVQLVLELFLLRSVALPELEQMRRGLRRPNAARTAFEQDSAQFVFEKLDLPRDDRRRRIDVVGGARMVPWVSTSWKYRRRCWLISRIRSLQRGMSVVQ